MILNKDTSPKRTLPKKSKKKINKLFTGDLTGSSIAPIFAA
jgi:hypothetical protein